jgi:hypothetical protein
VFLAEALGAPVLFKVRYVATLLRSAMEAIFPR